MSPGRLAFPSGVAVGASILSADFAELGKEIAAALGAGAGFVHVDVMDGHFVPNLSMGPAVCAAVRRAAPRAPVDVHLMVQRPLSFIEPFAKAGADWCTVHVEARDDPRECAERSRSLGMKAGLAFNPATPVEHALDAGLLEAADFILIMSVHPGYSGQAFIPEVLDKVRLLRRAGWQGPIEIDGGVSPLNADACRAAGCTLLVSASAIFGSNDYATAIGAMLD
ncbi:MAG: ribulose-phosphate 3-epimerase [Planctomycetes bacterium]|nr:ribulose-phosphate 3-epimerase [Planctomycetota bacterium]